MRTAQAWLGHTDSRLTLAIYTQATTETYRDAADRLGERLPRSEHGDTGRSLA